MIEELKLENIRHHSRDEYRRSSKPKKVILTYKELDQLIADVQYNIAGSAALQKLMIDSNFDGKDLNVLTQEFLEDVDYDLTATKEKIVNLAAGEGTATFAITSNKFNRDKANYEKYFKRFHLEKH